MNPIQENALFFWGIKFIVMVVIYLWLVAPSISNLDQNAKNIINVVYAFLTVFVVFALKELSIKNWFSFRK